VWWVASKARQAYLGARCVGLADAQGVWRWAEVASAAEGLDWLAQACAEPNLSRRTAIELWLSGALARPFVFHPVPGLKGWREAQQVARSLAAEETGLLGPCAVWLEEDDPRSAVLAVVVDQSTLDGVGAALSRGLGVKVSSIRPWWTKALAEALGARPELGSLVVEEPDAWTLLAGHVRQFQVGSACVPAPDGEDGAGWVRRTLFSTGIEFGPCVRASLVRSVGGGDGQVAAGQVALEDFP
jgi:hypothetical protein